MGSYYEVTGSTVTKYYFAGAQRIAMRSGGTLNFLLGDHLGSTSLTTSATGTVISELRYKAWGEVRYASGTTPTKYTYTGQFRYMDDPSTSGTTEGFGLMFYNARFYDPALGRFAQADSIIPPGVQGLDRYAYSNNSPLNYVDPNGHDRVCPPLFEGICDWAKQAYQNVANWWNEKQFNMCAGYLYSSCGQRVPKLPTVSDATKQMANRYAAQSWGGISPEQIRRIGQIADVAQRLEMLADIIGPSFDDDLYSSDNIDAITEHLSRPELDALDPDYAPYNPAMINRQIAIRNGEIEGTVYDQNWMRHELVEKSLMDQGMSYAEAHAAANKALGVEGDWDLWPTEIIEEFPDWLIGPAWVKPLSRRR